jgi:hypothetical protein
MSASEAARLANWAASRAHVAKNAFQEDAGLMNLAAAVERLAQAVAELATPHVSDSQARADDIAEPLAAQVAVGGDQAAGQQDDDL